MMMERVYPDNIFKYLTPGHESIEAIKFKGEEREKLAVYDGNTKGYIDVFGEFYDHKSADEFMKFLQSHDIVRFVKGGNK